MEREPGLKWLFFDLNSYFASVEQNENKRLMGRPVAVVPMDTPHTCAIAASYEAKAYGIKTGTIIRDARRMCPDLICVLARHDKYVEYHNRIISEVIKHTPINKIWSIDELSSRLPPARRTVDGATEIAMRIKRGLAENIGPAIKCSIGIAPNTLLAKIAGKMQKPDGLTILRQEDLPGPLLSLNLTDIPGIGTNMQRRLHRAGIFTMRQLWDSSPKQLRKIWSSVEGERFWYWLHGYDFEPPPQKGNVMIGHSRVLDPNLRAPEQARLMARRLLTKATYRLRRKGLYADTLCLGVRTVDGLRWRNDIRLHTPAQDPFTFLHHLDGLWSDMMNDAAHIQHQNKHSIGHGHGGVYFKKISTLLTGLREADSITGDIFDSRIDELDKTLKKRESLANALDSLQQKYQKETVWLGTVPKTLSGYVGTKIAFSRVPDSEEFWH